jgi:hypothetical protein
MKTAAIYARVSSDKQKEENTIASQTAALIAFAREQNCDVPPEWVIEDDAYAEQAACVLGSSECPISRRKGAPSLARPCSRSVEPGIRASDSPHREVRSRRRRGIIHPLETGDDSGR